MDLNALTMYENGFRIQEIVNIDCENNELLDLFQTKYNLSNEQSFKLLHAVRPNGIQKKYACIFCIFIFFYFFFFVFFFVFFCNSDTRIHFLCTFCIFCFFVLRVFSIFKKLYLLDFIILMSKKTKQKNTIHNEKYKETTTKQIFRIKINGKLYCFFLIAFSFFCL